MKIAGRAPLRRPPTAPVKCFNGAGDEDRRKVRDARCLGAAGPGASTEPAMKIAGRGWELPRASLSGSTLQRSRR